jgi:hypothetical protein
MILPWLVGQTLERLGPGAMTWLVTASLAANMLAFLGILQLRLAQSKANSSGATLKPEQGEP